MNMYNPPHPGVFIKETYLEPFGYSCRFLAKQLNVASSTLNRVLKGQSGITPEMALRLSKALGRTPETWLAMQGSYDLWHAKKNINLRNVHAVSFEVK
jgi:addiction module HigA family antidote